MEEQENTVVQEQEVETQTKTQTNVEDIRYMGVVKWFSEQKGFGFIEQTDAGDVFVHHTQIQSTKEFKTLREGQHVTFEIEKREKGLSAKNVRVITQT